jgi:Stage II sporulation protein/Carboxypeptidase regulatory-like domain
MIVSPHPPPSRRTFLRAVVRAGVSSVVVLSAAIPAVAASSSSRASPADGAGAGFAGRITDLATLQPVAGAVVRATPGGIEATSDAGGSYLLALPAGSYQLDIVAPGYISAIHPSELAQSGLTWLDLRLLPEAPTPEQQTLLYQRSVSQRESPLLALDPVATRQLQAAGVNVPPTISVYYDTGYNQGVAGPPPCALPCTVQVPLETYVKGVVPNEVPASWPADSLRAQAVAARSYGAASYLAYGYVYPDTRSQIYNPNNRQSTTDAAADATAGQVMTYGGSIITAFFYSECNGQTTRNSENAILQSTSPHPPPPYQCYTPTPEWNYVAYCRARPCTGHAPSLESDCGYWGHGVGMCQWGTYYHATAGMGYEDILRSYYTGISIVTGGSAPTPTFTVTPTPSPTPIPPPTTPQSVGPGLVLANRPFTLQWISIGTGVTYAFKLYAGKTATGTPLQQSGGGYSSTQWPLPAGLPLGPYTWTIQAFNVYGRSALASFPLSVVDQIYSAYAPWIGT